MKKLVIGVVIAIGVVALIVAAVFYMTSGVTQAGDRFFAMIRDGKAREAYQTAAREFRTATSEDQFLAFLKSSTIAQFESASWSSRSISLNVGELEGSLKTSGGGVIPIKLKLVKEDGVWKVLALEKSVAGLVSDSGSAAIPGETELITLANSSVMQLGRAINARDFSGFYHSSSKIWQSQTTPEALQSAFQSFIDQTLDLTMVEGKSPNFSEKPSIDGSGRLILQGFYPVQPSKINFTLKYIMEEKQWKLVGVNVSLEEAPPAARGVMPPETDLVAMTHGAVSLLARAVANNDFTEFHRSISKRWQAQTTPDELRQAFQVFVERKIPLNVIDGKKPEFTQSPSFDKDGVLIMEGQYLTEPFRVLFRLEFRNEDARWKLQGINVRTKEI